MASSATGSMSGAGSTQTGTDDTTYNLTSVLYHALQGIENCEIYAEDAQDDELRQFFEQACQTQRQIAEQAKRHLHDCLMSEIEQGGGQSASSGQSSMSETGQTGAQGGGSAFAFENEAGQQS
jgi:hypothetical protein